MSNLSHSAAYTYESYFDEALEELAEREEEEEVFCASHVSAPTSLPLSLGEGGSPSDTSSQHGHHDSGTGLDIQTPGNSSYTRMTSRRRNSDSGELSQLPQLQPENCSSSELAGTSHL